MKIYPAIDLQGGRVVRLSKGRFEDSTAYADDALAVARGFASAGARRLHLVDLDGTRDGTTRQGSTLAPLLSLDGLPVQVGGGLRSAPDAQALFDAGAAAVIVGSLAVADPAATRELLQRFGPARVVLALDCRLDDDGLPRVLSHGWTETHPNTLWQLLGDYQIDGLQQLLCTDVDRDGMLGGPNLELYRELLQRFPELRLQASGGVRHADDLAALAALGADGTIVGRALYEGTMTLAEALGFEDQR